MPIENFIDENKGYVLHVLDGKPKVRDIIQAASNRKKLPGFIPKMPVVWDLREVDFSDFSLNDVRHLAMEALLAKKERGWGFRLALVAEGDFEYGMSRMCLAHFVDLALVSAVFRTMDEALNWIRDPLELESL